MDGIVGYLAVSGKNAADKKSTHRTGPLGAVTLSPLNKIPDQINPIHFHIVTTQTVHSERVIKSVLMALVGCVS